MTTDRYDAIVVGVGGMGSAAAYHLARRGESVLGLERYDVPHTKGSSHGSTRIIRKAYHEHPDYVPLLRRAYDLWRDLETTTPADLLHVTGSLTAGPTGSELVEGAQAACEDHGLEYERLGAPDVNARFPGYDLPEAFDAVYQPEGGFLDAERCVIAHVEAAYDAGADIRAREGVLDWAPTDDGGVRVETEKGTYRGDRLVVTAGAWTGKLLPDLDPYLTPERQAVGWFQPHAGARERYLPDAFPVFIVDAPEGEFYGFPIHDLPGYKVGKYNHFHETVDPDHMDREPTRADERVLREFTEVYVPDAAGPTTRLETCLFTNTPDGDFIVDKHPEYPQVVVGAGFSGHGFKMSSVIGETLADLAVDGKANKPREAFRIDRF